jgi:quinol monooxygenase YgiN
MLSNDYAVVIRHTTKPGMRDDVERVWRRHMRPAIEANPEHKLYVYSFGADPDQIVAFQVYASADAANAFLKSPAYATYEAEVADLLEGPPQIEVLQPRWAKRGPSR